MSALGRLARRFANGFSDLAPHQRPHYRKPQRTIHESVAFEKAKAARMAAASKKK